jgi:hypothetical protein
MPGLHLSFQDCPDPAGACGGSALCALPSSLSVAIRS